MSADSRKTDETRNWRDWDRHEKQQTVRIVKERQARSAREAALAVAKTAELTKRIQDRAYFSLEEISNALARPDGLAKTDAEELEQIIQMLIYRAVRGELADDSGSPGAFFLASGSPPFQPLVPELPSADAAMSVPAIGRSTTFLSRSALHKFLRNSSLASASRLLREWFPDAAAALVVSSTVREMAKKRKLRTDEKRSKIAEALKRLRDSGTCRGTSNKMLCELVEKDLNQPKGWCTMRTLRRATEALNLG